MEQRHCSGNYCHRGCRWDLLGRWPKVAGAVSSLVALAVAVTPVSNWIVALFVFCAMIVIALVIIAGWAIAVPSTGGSSFPTYVEDEFFGIRWRWHYSNDGGIYSLVSFCSHCDYQIGPQNISGFRTIDHLQYRCDDCGAQLADFEMSLEEIESRVTRQIQKQIRNGNWPQARKNNSSMKSTRFASPDAGG